MRLHRALTKRQYRRLFSSTVPKKPGPKGPSQDVVTAVVDMKQRNPTWGCPRIAQQIALAFGIPMNKDVVRRILAVRYQPTPDAAGPSWLTVLGHAKDSLWAYAVTQRRREIGVRMALGAGRRDVLRLVLTRALRIVVTGLIVGLAGAAAVTRVLQTFLFGVTSTDPIVFTIVTLLLMAVGLMAAWLPARRATRIDPCAALRAE